MHTTWTAEHDGYRGRPANAWDLRKVLGLARKYVPETCLITVTLHDGSVTEGIFKAMSNPGGQEWISVLMRPGAKRAERYLVSDLAQVEIESGVPDLGRR